MHIEQLRPLLLVGAGGHGREILSIVDAMNAVAPTFELRGVVSVDGDPLGFLAASGIHLFESNEALAAHQGEYLIGVGDPRTRRQLDDIGGRRSEAAAVHPTAVLGPDVRHEGGFVAFPHVVVTTNVRFGRHVHLNAASTVSHDCVFGDFVTLSPGCHVSGSVTLEDEVTLGVGAVVRQGVTIGAGTTVGAGAVVVSDLPPAVVAVGMPARPIRERNA